MPPTSAPRGPLFLDDRSSMKNICPSSAFPIRHCPLRVTRGCHAHDEPNLPDAVFPRRAEYCVAHRCGIVARSGGEGCAMAELSSSDEAHQGDATPSRGRKRNDVDVARHLPCGYDPAPVLTGAGLNDYRILDLVIDLTDREVRVLEDETHEPTEPGHDPA